MDTFIAFFYSARDYRPGTNTGLKLKKYLLLRCGELEPPQNMGLGIEICPTTMISLRNRMTRQHYLNTEPRKQLRDDP
jgi:hypothetical protein